MLVYVNQLEMIGDEAFCKVFNSIAGWLKEQTGHHFTQEELLSGHEFSFDGKRVRTYKADAQDPKLYGILFSTPDTNVRGRQWVTEIGVRLDEGSIFFTLLLETSEISTRVVDIPVTTKPRIIKYLQENCQLAPSTIGVVVRELNDDTDNLRAFLSAIERPARNYPLVLVSPSFDGNYAVRPEALRLHLLGLAQVVVCDENMDSWKMERGLGRRYSAWGGAINIIYPPNRSGSCRNKLYLTNELDELRENSVNISFDILSRVTHFSNGMRKRRHFSPHDVRAKRAADYRVYLKKRFEQVQSSEDQSELLEEAFRQIDEHDQVVEELRSDYEKSLEASEEEALVALQEVDDKAKIIWQLESKLDSFEKSGTDTKKKGATENLLEAVHSPTPEKCLQVLEEIFPDRIKVLDSAWVSSRDSASFGNPQKLAHLLHRLATDYYDKISIGPDSEARKVFGQKEYAAQESETIRNNGDLLDKRSFKYRGEITPMLRHLKIGVADNIQETIRVHFHWDSELQLIAIGYCGPHLPISSQ